VSCAVRQGGLAVAAAAVAVVVATAGRADAPETLLWQRLPGLAGADVSAVAVDPATGRLAVGDARGVRIVDAGGGPRRVLRRGPVQDLLFHPGTSTLSAALLAATGDGLHRLTAAGAPVRIDVAPGAEARDVRRIAWVPGALGVATAAGAFVSADVARWRRLGAGAPQAPASALALRRRGAGLEAFAVLGGRLWRVELERSPEGWSARRAVREPLPPAAEGAGPVDVVLEVGGADVTVVFPDGFAVRRGPADVWRRVATSLPPGASARRLVVARGRLWLATQRGLLSARGLAGPWRRAAPPAGGADVRALAADEAGLYAAADSSVLVARPEPVRPPAPQPPAPRPRPDPPITEVHGRVLRYAALEPRRSEALRRGAAARGWLPVLSLRAGYAWDDDRGRDRDEAFLSGALRQLVDRERSRSRDFEVSAVLSWDLGDVAFHPEQVDVSREAREVVKLRDDVLDEVTQLYFERRRVLAELAAQPDASNAETERLRLRAAELGAGIDAWTGGWFSAARRAP
jgi:hypothetical protein